jgi:acetolactate synthase-1/2/3 large subunit
LAIGASVADRTRPVVAVIGDGSMELNIQELKTLQQVGTNVKIFIVNNGGYVSIRNTQDTFGGKHIGSEVGNVMNFKKIADAFGIQYRRLEHVDDLVGILALLSLENQMIIEVMCTTEQRIQ